MLFFRKNYVYTSRDSYDAVFDVLENYLDNLNLVLGATWFLSDYELNI